MIPTVRKKDLDYVSNFIGIKLASNCAYSVLLHTCVFSNLQTKSWYLMKFTQLLKPNYNNYECTLYVCSILEMQCSL